MRKRAADLSLEELAAMGTNAALKAALEAQAAGLTVTGTVDFLESGHIVSSLAERRPSGAVLGVNAADTATRAEVPEAGKPGVRNSAD